MKPEAPTRFFDMPFAQEGDYTIPKTYPDESTEGRTTLSEGFPEVTQLPVSKGGIAPNRWDFNGMYYMLSAFAFWQQSGGMMSWRSTLTYVPPSLVYYNGIFYVCVKESGPESDLGEEVRPTEDTEGEYWQSLLSYLSSSENQVLVGQGNTVTLSEDATGTGAFDAEGNVTVPTTVETASQLRTGRGITLSGDTTGTTTFDGSQDVSISTTTNTATALRTGRNISLAGDATGSLDSNFDGTANRTLTATVNTATQLRNSQNFSITGDVTASAVSFNGTGAVQLKATVDTSIFSGGMVPDWASATQCSKSTWYTAGTDGYFLFKFGGSSSGDFKVKSGSKSYSWYIRNGDDELTVVIYPMHKGDKYYTSCMDTGANIPSLWIPVVSS